jgi:hypothetical protein
MIDKDEKLALRIAKEGAMTRTEIAPEISRALGRLARVSATTAGRKGAGAMSDREDLLNIGHSVLEASMKYLAAVALMVLMSTAASAQSIVRALQPISPIFTCVHNPQKSVNWCSS